MRAACDGFGMVYVPFPRRNAIRGPSATWDPL